MVAQSGKSSGFVTDMNIDLATWHLKSGQAVVYPTDTAYGLGVDATNARAIKKLLKIKQRRAQPTHIVVSSLVMAKKYAVFSKFAEKLFKMFLPGPLTLVLELRIKNRESRQALELLSAGTGTIGIRMPDNKIALSLVKKLKHPITTPSANPKGGHVPYTIQDCQKQFSRKKYQPDMYLDAGCLLKRRPSTIVKIIGNKIEILRHGPISKKQMNASL